MRSSAPDLSYSSRRDEPPPHELELLLGPDDSPVPLLPSARLHVTAAVDAALAPRPAVV